MTPPVGRREARAPQRSVGQASVTCRPARPRAEPVDEPYLAPGHPDYPRILALFNDITGPLRARDICQVLDFELLPKHIERTRAKMKRLVTPRNPHRGRSRHLQ